MKKPNLLPVELIKENMLDFDVEYQQSLYNQVVYAIGEKARRYGAGTTAGAAGEYPIFPDIQPRFLRIGQSRRILNTEFIGMARTLQTEPEPDCPQVDKWTGEVRKQFFLERFRKHEWSEQFAMAFMDGEATGVGAVQVGMSICPDTGLPHVDLYHHHSYNIIFDRHERTPTRARWVVAVHYLSLLEAKFRFGEKATQYETVVESGTDGRPMRTVRVFEYWDKGIAGKAPTRAVVLGDLGNDPIEVTANPYGGCLPFGFFVYFTPPGMKRPMGRIPMQMAMQEAINDLENYLKKQLKQPDFTLLDSQSLDPSDLQRVMSGDTPNYVRVLKPVIQGMQNPAVRIPTTGIHQAVIYLQEMYERQFTADSGTTEFDRGMQAASQRTLGENQLVDARGGVQASWSELMLAKFYQRAIEKVFQVASMVDRSPLPIDVFGTNYTLNSDEDPDSMISVWLEEPSVVLINPQSLRRQDSAMKATERLAQLEVLAPHVGAGIDPLWFVGEKLKAIGETDPREAMGGADQAGQMETGLPPAGGEMPDNGQMIQEPAVPSAY